MIEKPNPGRPRKYSSRTRAVSIALPKDLGEILYNEADTRGISFSQLMRDLLLSGINSAIASCSSIDTINRLMHMRNLLSPIKEESDHA